MADDTSTKSSSSASKKVDEEVLFFWQTASSNYGKSSKSISDKIFQKKLISADDSGKQFLGGISVKRGGRQTAGLTLPSTFDELSQVLPEFLSNNLRSLRYEVPTSLQQHVISVGLAGINILYSSFPVRFPLYFSLLFF